MTVKPARAYAAVNYGARVPYIAPSTTRWNAKDARIEICEPDEWRGLRKSGWRIERVVVMREADYLELVKRSEGK